MRHSVLKAQPGSGPRRGRAMPPRRRVAVGLGAAAVLVAVLAVFDTGFAQIPGASQWKTDFDKHSVDLDEIMSGGPPKDGIPAVDEPRFVPTAAAAEWISAKEPVIAVSAGGKAKAYPLQILIWHEIVNDRFAGTPITVTFCPLCNSSIVFDRRVDGRVLDFGTTGRLRRSDLVMYDRQTETWWQQLIGEAIVGELTGTRLTQIPSDIVSFGDFRRAFPHGQVLSRQTGHARAYGTNPYRGYDSTTDRPFLFRGTVDPRLPPMERVLNLEVGGALKLYPFSALARPAALNDVVNDTPVVVFSGSATHSPLDSAAIAEGRLVPSVTAYRRTLEGQTLTFTAAAGGFRDRETGSSWDSFGRATAGPLAGKRLPAVVSGIHFAFAWLAFRPEAAIYGQ